MNYSSFTHIFVDHESLLDRFSVQMLSSPGGWLDMVPWLFMIVGQVGSMTS